MVQARGKSKKSELNSEDAKISILDIARRHFARHGFQGTNLKDVASDAGVANSLINYHYGDKEGLFKACMSLFGQSRLDAINRVLAEPKDASELRVRLELFVEEMIVSVISDPYGFEIIDHEIKLGNPIIVKLFQDTLLKGFKNVVEFFKQAQRNGLIDPALDPFIVAVLLFSATCDSSRKDLMGKTFFNVSLEEAEYRKKFTRHVVTIFLNGVVK